jgi:phage terminase Nu1 subunit (DNA packaging protein)
VKVQLTSAQAGVDEMGNVFRREKDEVVEVADVEAERMLRNHVARRVADVVGQPPRPTAAAGRR